MADWNLKNRLLWKGERPITVTICRNSFTCRVLATRTAKKRNMSFFGVVRHTTAVCSQRTASIRCSAAAPRQEGSTH